MPYHLPHPFALREVNNNCYARKLQKTDLFERMRVVRFVFEHYKLLVNGAMGRSFFAPRFFADKEMWNVYFYQMRKIIQQFFVAQSLF